MVEAALNLQVNLIFCLLLFYVKISSWVEPSFGEVLRGVGANKTLRKGTRSGESKTTRWPITGDQTVIKSRKRKGDLPVSDNQISAPSQAYKLDQDEPWVDIHAPQSQVTESC